MCACLQRSEVKSFISVCTEQYNAINIISVSDIFFFTIVNVVQTTAIFKHGGCESRWSEVRPVPESAKRIYRAVPAFICSDVEHLSYHALPSFFKTQSARAFMFKTCD